MRIEFQSELVKITSPLWKWGFVIPEEVVEWAKSNDLKRLICRFGSSVHKQVSLTSVKDQGVFITANAELRKELGLKEGDQIDLALEADESKYGLPLPEELKELFEQDPDGDRIFHTLTPGKQRSLLFIIGKPKSSDIRIKKSIQVLNYLKSTNGHLDYKELNEAMRLEG